MTIKRKNRPEAWTEDELVVLKEIEKGLKENGWVLYYIERRGKGWHFIIQPLEEFVDTSPACSIDEELNFEK